MTWMQTVSGQAVSLIDPKPETILLGDIAWHLSRIARFNGATSGDLPWNVAQHSLLVESLMPSESTPTDRLVALLHDAHEAYTGDIISPMLMALDKQCSSVKISLYIASIKRKLDTAIHTAFGIQAKVTAVDAAMAADFMALRIERAVLLSLCDTAWDMDARTDLPPLPDPLPVLRPAHPPMRAMEVFLDRFRILNDMRHGLIKAS